MTTYTVTDGGNVTSGLDLIEAADMLLGNDGHQHELRQDDDGGWSLWISQFSRNSTLGGRPLVKSTIYTLETNEELAARDIAEKVIGSGHWETSGLRCMTDEQHAAEAAELAADDCVLCKSPDGWSLHAPGSTDEQIASGEAAVLVCGDYVGPDLDRVPQSAYAIAAEILAGKRTAPVCLAI